MPPGLTTSRDYQDDADFRAVRWLLERTKSQTDPGFNWEVRRWDGFRWYRSEPAAIDVPVRLWLDGAGECVAAVHDEGPGIVFMQVDPSYRHLEPDFIEWAQQQLPAPELMVFCLDQDEHRQTLLASGGYRMTEHGEVTRTMSIDSIDRSPLPSPYRLAEMRSTQRGDRQRLADLLNAAFGRSFHNEQEFRVFAEHAPSYRDRLHLFAVAPDDSFAAHAATNLDSHNRTAIIEPVCTHPDHRGRELAPTLILETIRRAGEMGATAAEVYPGLAPELNRFYADLGLVAVSTGHFWSRGTS